MVIIGKSKGYIYIGTDKVPKPMLTQKELRGREKDILCYPASYDSFEKRKRAEVWY